MTLRQFWDNLKWQLEWQLSSLDGETIIFIGAVLLILLAAFISLWIFDWDWRCLLVECVITKP